MRFAAFKTWGGYISCAARRWGEKVLALQKPAQIRARFWVSLFGFERVGTAKRRIFFEVVLGIELIRGRMITRYALTYLVLAVGELEVYSSTLTLNRPVGSTAYQ